MGGASDVPGSFSESPDVGHTSGVAKALLFWARATDARTAALSGDVINKCAKANVQAKNRSVGFLLRA